MPSRTSSSCGVSTMAVTPICLVPAGGCACAGVAPAGACANAGVAANALSNTHPIIALIRATFSDRGPVASHADIQSECNSLSNSEEALAGATPRPYSRLASRFARGMKPAPFAYARPADLAEAIALLAAHGDDARPIAGGQSLMPMMAFRLSTPRMLVDIGRIPGLADIEIGSEA